MAEKLLRGALIMTERPGEGGGGGRHDVDPKNATAWNPCHVMAPPFYSRSDCL